MITFSDTQVDEAISKAPQQAQDLIGEGGLVQEVKTIAQTLALPTTQRRTIIVLARNMLIGLLRPTQFVSELKDAGVAEQVANAILKHLNETILKPVYDKKGGETQKPVAAVLPQKPTTTSTLPAPSQKPPIPASFPKALSAPKSLPVPAIANTPTPAEALHLTPSMPTPMRTMRHDAEGIKEQKPSIPFFSPPSSKTVKDNGQTMLPQIYTPPMPPPPPQSVQPPKPQPSAPTHEEISGSLKQYGIDPYREPVQ